MEEIEHIVATPLVRTHRTPLLLLHGAWHAAWCWDHWIRPLSSRGREVHAISLPGHGGSSCAKGHINRYTLDDYVDTLASEVSKISPLPVVVGHSMGGGILQKYLECHSLPGAVLLATAPARGTLAMVGRMLVRHPVTVCRSLLTRDFYRWVATEALARELFLGPSASPGEVRDFQRKLCSDSMSTTALLLPYARMNVVRTPVLVLAGERDRIFTVAEQRATARKYGADLVVFAGQAHDLMLEPQWARVADTVEDWITRRLDLP